jgi:NADH-quinone oxidoreductase subunit N
LAVVAVINTVVSLFYYLRVIASAVLSPPEANTPAPAGLSNALAAGLLVATVGLGVIAEPLLDLANNAALMPGR